MHAFYLHVDIATRTVTQVRGRLTAEQLKQGRVQHYPHGVTLHFARGLYLVGEPEGYEDGSTLYREYRSLVSAHRAATVISSGLPGVKQRRAEREAERHGVAPYTDAERLRDAWGCK